MRIFLMTTTCLKVIHLCPNIFYSTNVCTVILVLVRTNWGDAFKNWFCYSDWWFHCHSYFRLQQCITCGWIKCKCHGCLLLYKLLYKCNFSILHVRTSNDQMFCTNHLFSFRTRLRWRPFLSSANAQKNQWKWRTWERSTTQGRSCAVRSAKEHTIHMEEKQIKTYWILWSALGLKE